MKPRKIRLYPLAVLCLVLLFLSSCYSVKKIVYFSNLKDTANGKFFEQDSIQRFQALIEPGDILDIHVSSLNPTADAPFNTGSVVAPFSEAQTTKTDAVSGSARGYMVDRDGYIDYPVLGKIKTSGEPTSVLRDTLEARLQPYLTQPTANVRFLNFKINILGEVNHPATYTISNERVSIIDAVAMAGDLTIYGKRENILVVREVDGKREFARLNLSSSDVFKSPYYFLKQNDIVYVEPSRPKIASSDERVVRNISIASGMIAIVISLIYLIK